MFFIRWTSWPFRSINSTTTTACSVPECSHSRYHLVAVPLYLVLFSAMFYTSNLLSYLIIQSLGLFCECVFDKRSDLVWYDLVWSDLVWSDLEWSDLIRRSNFLTCIGLCLCCRLGERSDQSGTSGFCTATVLLATLRSCFPLWLVTYFAASLNYIVLEIFTQPNASVTIFAPNHYNTIWATQGNFEITHFTCGVLPRPQTCCRCSFVHISSASSFARLRVCSGYGLLLNMLSQGEIVRTCCYAVVSHSPSQPKVGLQHLCQESDVWGVALLRLCCQVKLQWVGCSGSVHCAGENIVQR